uniref:Uncharacterized protein n=1 Tax=Caenorhabditis tropicalis TaxID=1561998 RepID=A0A1I7TJB9_9PELO
MKHVGTSANEAEAASRKKESEQIKNSIEAVVNNNNNNNVKKSTEKDASPKSAEQKEHTHTDGSEENQDDLIDLQGVQDVAAALNLFLNAGQTVNNAITSPATPENNEEGEEIGAEENAKLIMLTLSHLFSIPTDALFS